MNNAPTGQPTNLPPPSSPSWPPPTNIVKKGRGKWIAAGIGGILVVGALAGSGEGAKPVAKPEAVAAAPTLAPAPAPPAPAAQPALPTPKPSPTTPEPAPTTPPPPAPALAPAAAPPPPPAPAPTPEPTYEAPAPEPAYAAPATQQQDVFYANCTEARAAGAAPIYRGQPGYREGLDRDKGGPDGIACE